MVKSDFQTSDSRFQTLETKSIPTMNRIKVDTFCKMAKSGIGLQRMLQGKNHAQNQRNGIFTLSSGIELR